MWFQNDWVHDTYIAEGSEIFLNNDTYIEQSKAFYNADIIEPHSVYVNIMAAINDGGPAHTDNHDSTDVNEQTHPCGYYEQ